MLNNGNRAFTPEQVRMLRKQYADGGVTYLQLAKEWGVSLNTISRLIKGETYGGGQPGRRVHGVVHVDPSSQQDVAQMGERLMELQKSLGRESAPYVAPPTWEEQMEAAKREIARLEAEDRDAAPPADRP